MDDQNLHTPADGSDAAAMPDTCEHCQEYLDGWKRAQADYANLKKEVERDKSDLIKYANERLLHELLPAVDQFETALSFTPDAARLPDDERPKWTNWVTGMNAVRSLWSNAFQSIGLEKVSSTGMFDPQLHDAVEREAHPDIPSGHIVRTIQDGWRLHGKVLRPAKVIVAE